MDTSNTALYVDYVLRATINLHKHASTLTCMYRVHGVLIPKMIAIATETFS